MPGKPKRQRTKRRAFGLGLDFFLRRRGLSAAAFSRGSYREGLAKPRFAPQSVCEYRRGWVLPEGERMFAIADQLGIELDQLLKIGRELAEVDQWEAERAERVAERREADKVEGADEPEAAEPEAAGSDS